MLSFEPDSSHSMGSRSSRALAVVKLIPVTTVGPTDGVTRILVGSVSPLKCRYFVSIWSSMTYFGNSVAGQPKVLSPGILRPSFGTPMMASPGLVMSRPACNVPLNASIDASTMSIEAFLNITRLLIKIYYCEFCLSHAPKQPAGISGLMTVR